jgi:hypothetical protein
MTLALLLIVPAGLAGAGVEMDSTLTDAFGHLGLNEYDSMEIINRSLDIEDASSFRFAANFDPATIDSEEAAWGFPTRIGVTWAGGPTRRPFLPSPAHQKSWVECSICHAVGRFSTPTTP